MKSRCVIFGAATTALIFSAASANAVVNDADIDVLISFAEERCLEPMQAGELPDLSGLPAASPETLFNYGGEIFSGDDRILLSVDKSRGLIFCSVDTNVLTASVDEGSYPKVFDALDSWAEQISKRQDFFEDGPCVPTTGSWGRNLIGTREGRPNLYLSIIVSATSTYENAGILVSERYGKEATLCQKEVVQ